MTPAESQHLARIQAVLARLVRADDKALRRWLASWRDDGGDARRFRRGMRERFGGDEVAAWRYCEHALTPLRPRIRQVARALLVHPQPLPYRVAAAIASGA